jgi:hypothetical protein
MRIVENPENARAKPRFDPTELLALHDPGRTARLSHALVFCSMHFRT